MIYMAGGNAYSLVHEHKNGWNPEAFRERFSEVLERYDYIVGDWGYNQLRLRGFYRNQQPKAAKDSIISGLSEYINEYCNFGCAYFVLEKTDLRSLPEGTQVVAEDAPIGARKEDDEAAEGDEAAPAAVSMAEAVAAAMAASPTGMLLRWPLKERPGGRVPGTSPSAVARAVSEGAERRAAAAAAAQAGTGGRPDSPGGRSSHEAGGHGFGGGRSRGDGSAPGRDRRPHHSGGGSGSRSGGRQDRGPGGGGGSPRGGSGPYPTARDGYGERQSRHAQQPGGNAPAQPSSPQSGGEGGGHASRGSSAGGSGNGRWGGKNRRRGSGGFHGGKPNRPRPEDGQRFDGSRRPDAGSSGGERP